MRKYWARSLSFALLVTAFIVFESGVLHHDWGRALWLGLAVAFYTLAIFVFKFTKFTRKTRR